MVLIGWAPHESGSPAVVPTNRELDLRKGPSSGSVAWCWLLGKDGAVWLLVLEYVLHLIWGEAKHAADDCHPFFQVAASGAVCRMHSLPREDVACDGLHKRTLPSFRFGQGVIGHLRHAFGSLTMLPTGAN
jgi:hypothetical protein